MWYKGGVWRRKEKAKAYPCVDLFVLRVVSHLVQAFVLLVFRHGDDDNRDFFGTGFIGNNWTDVILTLTGPTRELGLESLVLWMLTSKRDRSE